jgi:hypothetical protein
MLIIDLGKQRFPQAFDLADFSMVSIMFLVK